MDFLKKLEEQLRPRLKTAIKKGQQMRAASAQKMRQLIAKKEELSSLIFGQESPTGILYQANKKGCTLYLLAIPQLVSKEFQLPEYIVEALDKSAKLMIESDESRIGPDFIAQFKKEVRSFRRAFPAKQIALISEEIAERLSESSASQSQEPLEHFFAAVDRLHEEIYRQMGLEESFGRALLKAAQGRGLYPIELEDSEEQRKNLVQAKVLGYLTLLSFQKTDEHILGYIAALKKALQLAEEAWQTRRLSGLAKMPEILFPEETLRKEYLEKLIHQRNQKAASFIDQQAEKDKPCFITCGIDRFLGNEGLLQQLQKNGWSLAKLPL
ncbi:MAG: TraB family [Chlamydiales bacterium]|jgi:uncharacterized protein YbaP (TraB family)|nr:TraB family [Chlamydiales bacterium]